MNKAKKRRLSRLAGSKMKARREDFAETCDFYVCRPAGELPLADNKLAICCDCGISIMHRPDGPVHPPKICMNCAVIRARRNQSETVSTDDGHKAEDERS